MPNPSLSSTCTSGARQFVVQEALETMWFLAGSYLPSFTPMTTVRQSPLAGAEMMTFFAPAVMWPWAFSTSVNKPVDSITRSTPSAFHGSSAGDLALTTLMSLPLTMRMSSSGLSAADFFDPTSPLNRPWREWFLSRYARLSAGTMSPTATTSMSLPTKPCSTSARNTRRPMRPNPLIATFTAIYFYFYFRGSNSLFLIPNDKILPGRARASMKNSGTELPNSRHFLAAAGTTTVSRRWNLHQQLSTFTRKHGEHRQIALRRSLHHPAPGIKHRPMAGAQE